MLITHKIEYTLLYFYIFAISGQNTLQLHLHKSGTTVKSMNVTKIRDLTSFQQLFKDF